MKKRIKVRYVNIANLSDILSKRQMEEVRSQLDESGWFEDFVADPMIVATAAFESDVTTILDTHTPNIKDILNRIGTARVLTDYLVVDF